MELIDLLKVDPVTIGQLAGYIAIGVFVMVQALKVFGVVKDKVWAGRSALIVALALGGLAGVAYFMPSIAPAISVVYGLFLGAALAGLFYEYLAKPILEKLGLDISSGDLNGS